MAHGESIGRLTVHTDDDSAPDSVPQPDTGVIGRWVTRYVAAKKRARIQSNPGRKRCGERSDSGNDADAERKHSDKDPESRRSTT